jgi:hypothetical protein
MTGRHPLALLVLLALLAFPAPVGAAEWHSEQPITAPSGVGVPSEIGEIGDIEFWAPNRGVLITAGNSGIAPGIFAYDGTGWYRYATVCGGHEGRIAWAGPTEFWTVSDQQPGQELPPGDKRKAWHRSLCHFKDGAVLASYGEPIGQAGSYMQMTAAACSGPDNCWFAGDRLPGTVNEGAFHLHWDGASLTATPSLSQTQPQIEDPSHSVTGLAFYGGELFEGVRVQSDDNAPGEPSPPPLLHRIDPSQANPFEALDVPIDYPPGSTPEGLERMRFSAGQDALWAAFSGTTSFTARLTVLRKVGAAAFAQLPLEDPGEVLELGTAVGGLAAEPGGSSAWLGFRPFEDIEALVPARLVRIGADGSLGTPVSLPKAGEGLSPKGAAGPVACAAAGQCWMATERGWLFHLGDSLPQDTEPAMHALIAFRPRDNSVPVVPPTDLPDDDSGASSPFEYQPGEEPEAEQARRPPRKRALLTGLRQRVIAGRVLELSFVLHARAQVRLVAKLKRQVIATTPSYTMGEGHRKLRLRLDPERWPTDLDLQIHAVKGKGAR